MALKLGIQALGSYLKPNCEYELHIIANTKVGAAKDHGENYMKVKPHLVCHLLRNRLYIDNLYAKYGGSLVPDFYPVFNMILLGAHVCV